MQVFRQVRLNMRLHHVSAIVVSHHDDQQVYKRNSHLYALYVFPNLSNDRIPKRRPFYKEKQGQPKL